MVFSKYLRKEIIIYFLIISVCMISILLCIEANKFLIKIISGKIYGNDMWKIILLELPYVFMIILPFSLYLSIVLVLAKLYSSNELIVFHCCVGYSRLKIFFFLTPIIFIIICFVAICAFEIYPNSIKLQNKILSEIGVAALLNTITPGRFVETHNGSGVIYAEDLSKKNKNIKKIFYAQLDNGKLFYKKNQTINFNSYMDYWIITTANNGYKLYDNGMESLVVENGTRYNGIPGEKGYEITHFDKYTQQLHPTFSHEYDNRFQTLTTKDLFSKYKFSKDVLSELFWRASLPFSVLLFAFFAIPLGYVPSKHSRYSNIIPAILIYLFYVNIILAARNIIERDAYDMSLEIIWPIALLMTVLFCAWRLRGNRL